MKKLKNNRNRIKIPEIDLQTFLIESISVDPYWDDLYNPKPKKVIFKYKNNERR